MTIKEFFSFKTNKFFWLNIVAMIVVVVVMIFGVLKWMDVYTHHGETVVVPDVKGMTTEEAANSMVRDKASKTAITQSTTIIAAPRVLESGCGLDFFFSAI